MDRAGNIVIGDESAEFFLLHDDASRRIDGKLAWANPLEECARDVKEMTAFNANHPLYGGRPVTLLVPDESLRRKNADIICHNASGEFPARSFFELRDGLFMATPECAFARAANRLEIPALAELGVNLCGRYYLAGPACEIKQRSNFITTPEKLSRFAEDTRRWRGIEKARMAAKYIVLNSGSPYETKTWVQYRLPVRYGGLGFPFTHMNYDVKAGRFAGLTSQSSYCLDIVAADLHLAFEFDGFMYHLDHGRDKKRRNDLKVLGWDVYPIEGDVLLSPDETIRVARQLARIMGKRLRLDAAWEKRFIELRQAINLPV